MAAETVNLRTQILANAKFMLKTTPTPATAAAVNNNNHYHVELPEVNSQATLIPPPTTTRQPATSPGGIIHHNSLSNENNNEIDILIFGYSPTFTAAVMVGRTPAIEGDRAPTPELALRKLFSATCELLNAYIPKVGAHQRNIHGGGVFDEDMISETLTRTSLATTSTEGTSTAGAGAGIGGMGIGKGAGN